MSSSSRRPRHEAATSNGWAALPRAILLDVFLKLGPREVMLGAEFACRAWRRAALEEPALWRIIGRDPVDWMTRRCVGARAESAMAFAGMERAAGQCEAFTGACCDDEDLMHLVERAPCLKSLDIEHHGDGYSYEQSGKELAVTLKKLTLLEDLQIHFNYIIDYSFDWEEHENMLQSVCQACPHLKKLVIMYASKFDLELNEDEFDMEPIYEAIPVMRDLHTLELYDCDLSCKGLKAILDSCPLLQNLRIAGYFNEQAMDEELRMKCARLKDLTLPELVKPQD